MAAYATFIQTGVSPSCPPSGPWCLSVWWKSDGDTHTHTQPLRLILGVVLFDVRRLNPRRRSSEPPAVCMLSWYHITPVPNRRPRCGLINGRHSWVGADKHVSMVFLTQPVSLRCLLWRQERLKVFASELLKGTSVCASKSLKASQPSHKREAKFDLWRLYLQPCPYQLTPKGTRGKIKSANELLSGVFPNRTAVCRLECKCEWI